MKGARDYFPKDYSQLKNLFSKWESCSKSFGYSQYETPVVDRMSLWGEEFSDSMFQLKIDNKDYVLRPEMTPILARLVLSDKSLKFPLKWFSISQCYRNDSIGIGRKREFYQWNVDYLTETKILPEIEIIILLIDFFKSINLTSSDVTIKISDILLVKSYLIEVINDSQITKVLKIIDSIDKNTTENTISELEHVCPGKSHEILKILSEISFIKSETLTKLTEVLRDLDLINWITIDFKIVRGLGYYTGFVFEAFYKNSEITRAICGGGRYSKQTLTGVGFGMGNIIIEDRIKLIEKSKIDYFIALDDLSEAFKISEKLRKDGNTVEISHETSLKKSFKYADKINCENIVFKFENILFSKNLKTKIQKEFI